MTDYPLSDASSIGVIWENGLPLASNGASGSLGAGGFGGAGGTLILVGTAVDAPDTAVIDVSAGASGAYYDERYFDQGLTDAQRQAYIYKNSRTAQDGRVVISSNVDKQWEGGLDAVTEDGSVKFPARGSRPTSPAKKRSRSTRRHGAHWRT